jgi:hypothetical protein
MTKNRVIEIRDSFQTANGVIPGGGDTMTRQHTNIHITYIPNIHITQNNTTKKKQTRNKSAHKATQTAKDILEPMNTA